MILLVPTILCTYIYVYISRSIQSYHIVCLPIFLFTIDLLSLNVTDYEMIHCYLSKSRVYKSSGFPTVPVLQTSGAMLRPRLRRHGDVERREVQHVETWLGGKTIGVSWVW